VISAPPSKRFWVSAAGLSAINIARLTAGWGKEYTDFRQRDLSGREYVYVWVDGVHFSIRLDDDRLCTLVMIGARPDGQKELLAVEDGYRESAESWKTALRELKRRGLVAPVLAAGDGAIGFWAAAREVWPKTREQGCRCHKLANVLDKLPQRLHSLAKSALHEIMYAARRSDCEAARVRFAAEYQAKYPKAVTSLTANWERLVSFFDFPAEHWKHLRTTNVIESAFATVRLRERATKGAGSRSKGLLMAFKLLDMAQQRWPAAGWRRPPAAGPCWCEVRRWSSETSAKRLLNQLKPRHGKPPDHAGRSTTFDNLVFGRQKSAGTNLGVDNTQTGEATTALPTTKCNYRQTSTEVYFK